MKSRFSLIAIALFLAVSAQAQFKTVQLAHEVLLTEFRLPGTESGTIGFKPCETCDYRTERVSPQTTYVVNGNRVSLRQFGEALAGVSDRSAVVVNVLHHLERNVVTKIWVDLH